MITIKRIEVGYGIFDGDRLAVFIDRQEDYAGLVNIVINVNTKLEIDRIKAEIENLKANIKGSKNKLFANYDAYRISCLRSDLHWLENYNV